MDKKIKVSDKLRNEKIEKLLGRNSIAMKFILHCQKINASKLSFDNFKDFCAHQNFGLTRIERKMRKAPI